MLEQVVAILPQQVVFGLALGALYAMLAVGYTMVYGVLFMINFAHGDILMIGSMAAWLTLTFLSAGGAPIPILAIGAMVIVAMIVSAVLGGAIERIAYRPLYTRGSSRLGPVISALGIVLILENSVVVVMGAQPRVFPTSILFADFPGVELADVRIGPVVLLIAVVTFVSMLLLERIINYTRWGRGMRAVRENRVAAQLMGVDINRIVSITFLIGSGLAGLCGVLIVLYYTQTDFLVGWFAGLKAFTAAVLGGIGNVRGAILGGLVLGLVESIGITALAATESVTGFGTGYKDVIAFTVLILVLIFKPRGILGEETGGAE